MTLQRTAVVCALASACAMTTPDVRAATVWLVTFTIDDGDYAVSSDHSGESGNENEYQDFRLGSDKNFCVEASPYSTGDLFVRLNRKLDGDAGVLRCSEDDTHRQFSLEIANQTACDDLSSNEYLLSNWVSGPCTITGGPNPRIRIGNLWAKSPRFPIDFLTTNPTPGHPISYEIQTEANVVISSVAGSPNSKVATYTGNARLVKFGEGKPKTVAQSIPLLFHMTFTRTQ